MLLAIRSESFTTLFQLIETQISVTGDSQVEAVAEVSSKLPVDLLVTVSGIDYVYDPPREFLCFMLSFFDIVQESFECILHAVNMFLWVHFNIFLFFCMLYIFE